MDAARLISEVLLSLVPFLLALCVHEYAHGWVATRLGDPTAKLMGRLTLNPVAHADPIGTIVLPVMAMVTGLNIFFGWAKPVPVNANNLKNPKVGMFWVALAGPGSNLLMALIGSFFIVFLYKYYPDPEALRALKIMLNTFLSINLVLAFFNLLPIHPLDGGKVFAIFFPESVNQKLEEMQLFLSFALLALVISGSLWAVMRVPVRFTADHMLGFWQMVLG